MARTGHKVAAANLLERCRHAASITNMAKGPRNTKATVHGTSQFQSKAVLLLLLLLLWQIICLRSRVDGVEVAVHCAVPSLRSGEAVHAVVVRGFIV